MKISFVVFNDNIPDSKELGDINNTEIKFGICKVATRKTANVNPRFFLKLVFDGKVLWKYRMYDMNNRRRNVWLIKEKDYEQLIEWSNNDNQRLF